MIQTRGFGVQVMPQYTPVNANLAGYAPAQILGGALDAFKVAQAYNALRAQMDEANERKQLRQDRLAATKAGYSGVVRQEAEGQATSAGRVGAENVRNRSVMDVLPSQTADTLADIEVKGRDRAFGESTRGARESVAASQVNTAAELAETNSNIAKQKAALETMSIADELKSFDYTSAVGMAVKKLVLDEKKADIELKKAQADYYSGRNDASGKSNKSEKDVLLERASKVTNLIKSMLSKNSPGSNETLEAYRNRTRDETGKVNVKPTKLNPDNERELDQIFRLERIGEMLARGYNALEQADAMNQAFLSGALSGESTETGEQSTTSNGVQTFTIDPESGELIPVQ